MFVQQEITVIQRVDSRDAQKLSYDANTPTGLFSLCLAGGRGVIKVDVMVASGNDDNGEDHTILYSAVYLPNGGNGEDMSVMGGRVRKIGTRSRVNWFATFNLLQGVEIQMTIQIQTKTKIQIQLTRSWVNCGLVCHLQFVSITSVKGNTDENTNDK